MLFKMATQIPIDDRFNRPDKLFKEIAAVLAEPKMKELILRRVISPIWKIVDTYANVMCQHEDCTPPECQQNIYEWSFVKFKRRMQLHKLYIDELYTLDPRILEILKISTDFKNLNDVLKFLYDGSVAIMLTKFKGCKKLQNIQEDLGLRYWVQSKILQRLIEKHNSFNQYEEHVMNELTTRMFKTMDECNDVSHVGDPIISRYQHNFVRVNCDVEIYKLEMPVKQLRKDIQFVAHNSIRKLALSETTQGFFGNQISELRNKINNWSNKYDEDYEKINQILQVNKWNLQVLEIRWQEYRDRIEFFREEVQRCLEQDRIAAELQKQREEEQELLRATDPIKQRKRKSRVKGGKR